MTNHGENDALLEPITDELWRSETTLLAEVIAYARAEFPSYVPVSDAELADSFHQNVAMAVDALLSGSLPSEAMLMGYARIARSRFEAEVPVDDLIRSYRYSMGLIADRVAALATDHDLAADRSLDAYRLLWAVSDTYTGHLVDMYRQHQLRLDLGNHHLKTDLLDRLRSGSYDDVAAKLAEGRFRLRPDQEYMAFLARWSTGDEDLYPLLTRVESRMTGHRGLSVIQGGLIVGVCTDELGMDGQVTVAYGPRAPLPELAASFTTAAQVLRTSTARAAGDFHLEDVTWRSSVTTNGHLLSHLHDRFVRPLMRGGVDVDTALESVRVFLESNRSYPHAASVLYCHPNTLRYRVSRFEELTGADVESSETITSLQWLFEAQQRP